MKTAKAQSVFFAARARINAGADLEAAVVGAIRECGPLRAVRVSSAQAKGAAKKYAYWGAVRYAVALTADGRGLKVEALERASSDRRSVRLAERDAEALISAEDRVWSGGRGRVPATTVARMLGL